ncbi:GORK [Symbiodinium sp. CCMP2456]|nr:GORK [Symbiodinium sp. CCMP2456]
MAPVDAWVTMAPLQFFIRQTAQRHADHQDGTVLDFTADGTWSHHGGTSMTSLLSTAACLVALGRSGRRHVGLKQVTMQVSSRWLQSNPSWENWLPDRTKCSPGFGLYDTTQDTFIGTRADTTFLEPCLRVRKTCSSIV